MSPSTFVTENPINLLAINEQLVLATLRAQALADEVAESEERFRSLVTSTAAIIWYADASGHVRTDPDRWREVTGWDSAEVGWDWLADIYAQDRAGVAAAWARSLATRTVFECECRIGRRDGRTLWVFARAVPLPVDGDLVREWIGMMTDISERKSVDETRERFIGILGHDLRSPLTAMQMGVESMEQADDLPEHHARMAAIMSNCSRRMARMIADVLDFARGRLGSGIPLVRAPTSFGAICQEALTEFRLAHPERKITLEASEDLDGVWDRDRLGQVLTNLVSNAVAHGVGRIAVTLRPDGDAVVLDVHNGGPPIRAENLRGIFDPFQRSTNHGESDGLGLGLYIVSEIVRAHGATISVRSSVEGGTTFSSRWPRRPPEEPTSAT